MRISTGKSRQDINWKIKNVSWQTLCKKLATPVRTKETVAEYKAMNKDNKAKAKDVGGFVGGAVVGGRRTKSNVESRSMITLDADYADKDVWDRITSLFDYAVCCYSTHSHTPNAPRLRFIIPLSREVTPEEYEPIARMVADDIGIEQFDVTTYEISRLMFWPSVPADGEYVFEVNEGEFLSPDKILGRYKDWHDTTEWPISSQETVIRNKQAKLQGDPESKPGIVGLFCRTYDIRSAIDTFLSDVYEPCGERYTYTGGSTSGGAVVYQDGKFLYSHHSTDPAGGVLCNAFDLVRLHKFGELDKDVSFDTPITKYPSYVAMSEFASNDNECKKELLEQTLSEAKNVFENDTTGSVDEEEDVAWAEKLAVGKKGEIVSSINNICIILEHDKNLRDKMAFNLFTNRVCVIEDLPWKRCEDDINGTMWDDMDDSGLRFYLEKTYGISGKDKIADALNVVMMNHAFHPVRSYLGSLEWDGVPRVESIFVKYFGAEDTVYTRAVTRKWFTAAVARIMNPGCKFDNMIVLVGAQGIGKSYFGNLIGKYWYSDTFNTLGGKEAYEQLKGCWILEMGELSVMKRAEVESVKMFISKQEDNYRSAYNRHVMSNKRQCVFYGTTNDDAFLRDHTGNRRFWPIGCHPERAKREVFDITPADVDQFWAEVTYWYKHGESLYLSKDESEAAAREQAMYTQEDPRLGAVEAYLDKEIPVSWETLSKTDRRNYVQGYLPYDGQLKKRTSISVVELAYELYGEETLQPWQAKEYHNMLISLGNWEKGKRKVDPVYGRQFVYERRQ